MVSKPLDVLRKGLEHLQNHVKAQAVMDLDAHNTTDCNDADDPGPIKSSPTHTKALQAITLMITDPVAQNLNDFSGV